MEEKVVQEQEHNIYYMTSLQIEEWLKKTDIILVPIGSCEQHGPHLPVATDGISAWLITVRAAKKADVPHTPLIWMGYSPQHVIRPGTITLREDTFQNLIYDVARSLIHMGFNKVIFATGHTSNIKILDSVLRKIRYETGALVGIFRADAEFWPKVCQDIFENPPEETPGWHGSEGETSVCLLFDPKCVDLEKMVATKVHAPRWLTEKFSKRDGNPYVILDNKYEALYLPMDHNEYSDTGVIGNPYRATREKGEKIVERMATIFAEYINELKKVKIVVKNREFINRV
ncbi:MAG: creatininase family protein [Nitrososphaerota archaeon]